MKHQLAFVACIIIFLSCKKENIDPKDKLHIDVSTAANKNVQKALPKRIWHAYGSYAHTWDLIYNKKGLVDSIDFLGESIYYGQWRMGYKVYYSGTKIDSVVRTRWGYVWDVLKNIKYENGLIVQGDFYFAVLFDNSSVRFKIEYDKKKRPLNSPLGEKFYYNEKGQLVSYTHPIWPQLNASFTSDNAENPIHRIPDLNIILLNEYETAVEWYNPNIVTAVNYTNGVNVKVDNTFDYFGNLIIRSYPYGMYATSHQWNIVY